MGAKLTRSGLVMVNFTCQFDWAMEFPDIWLKITLHVSVRVFLDKTNTRIVNHVKQIAFPNVGVNYSHFI